MPKRIQMSRQRPWRADNPDAVIVARPSVWGNPYRVGDDYLWLSGQGGDLLPWPLPTVRDPGEHPNGIRVETCPDRATAVVWFRAWFESMVATGTDPAPLRGRDLACWCPLDQPCHADVLLELANGGA
jgi:hypothetical protein